MEYRVTFSLAHTHVTDFEDSVDLKVYFAMVVSFDLISIKIVTSDCEVYFWRLERII